MSNISIVAVLYINRRTSDPEEREACYEQMGAVQKSVPKGKIDLKTIVTSENTLHDGETWSP